MRLALLMPRALRLRLAPRLAALASGLALLSVLAGACDDADTDVAANDAAADVLDLAGDVGGDDTAVAVCAEGSTRSAGDGCNTCSCTGAQWQCTRLACGPAGVCPAPAGDGAACTESVVVYAQDPVTNTCCRYGSPCDAPAEWARFFSQQECEAACEVGATRLLEDGCNTCTCTSEGGWACTEHACPEDNGCASDADCMMTGCHGQVCASEAVETSCEWSDAWSCFEAPATSCGCQQGVCGWAPTPELGACLDTLAWCRPGEVRSAQDGCNLCWCDAESTWQCGQKDCRVCPAEIKDDRPCAGGEVWARDPVGGLCCRYSAACMSPRDWPLYESAQECEQSGCEPGETRPARDGCNSCVCGADRSWSCTREECAVQHCESDADCVVTGCNGEMCAAEHLFTSCEWEAEFACYAEPFTRCGCQEGVCGWAQRGALELCLNASTP